MKEWVEKDRLDNKRDRQPAKWVQKRAWEIHRCKISKKLILPRELAWRKTYHYYGTGRPAFSDWLCNDIYLMEKLKGNL